MLDQTQRASWGEDITGKDEMTQTESRVSGLWGGGVGVLDAAEGTAGLAVPVPRAPLLVPL